MIGTMSDSLNGTQDTSLYSLDGVPGKSPIVAVRLRKADAIRLAAIAQHFGVPRSRVIRVALASGLVEVERDGLPDDDGQSTAPDNAEGDR
jgi:hypothetical protein